MLFPVKLSNKVRFLLALLFGLFIFILLRFS